MLGINQSKVTVTLRNPLDHSDQLSYDILVFDNPIAQDWMQALKGILLNGNQLEKNFCFLGFPGSARTLPYLCDQVNQAIDKINGFFSDYQINEHFTPENCLATDYAENGPNHKLLNQLHNHFERLQGTVSDLSVYYKRADYGTKYAIRQLNHVCHEMESLILSQRKLDIDPDWVRPSQITTFLQCPRYELTDEHRELFSENGYDRDFGGVYMHWTQIGKTLFEVFRDEGAPKLDETTCEAITHLQYYSGEFDIEWGNDVVYGDTRVLWHNEEQARFQEWLLENDLDPKDPTLSLGYLPLGMIDTLPFGTHDPVKIREVLGRYLDIYKIEIDGVSNTFDYCWTDSDYKQKQIDRMIPGYDFSSRG